MSAKKSKVILVTLVPRTLDVMRALVPSAIA
jgi:hypothetical protein